MFSSIAVFAVFFVFHNDGWPRILAGHMRFVVCWVFVGRRDDGNGGDSLGQRVVVFRHSFFLRKKQEDVARIRTHRVGRHRIFHLTHRKIMLNQGAKSGFRIYFRGCSRLTSLCTLYNTISLSDMAETIFKINCLEIFAVFSLGQSFPHFKVISTRRLINTRRAIRSPTFTPISLIE